MKIKVHSHGTLVLSAGSNKYMNKKQIQQALLKHKWKTNPFAISWKQKNDIIAIKRMWLRILTANNK